MARIWPCDMGHPEQVEAAYLITDQANGDVTALCVTCVVEWAGAVVQAAYPAPDPADGDGGLGFSDETIVRAMTDGPLVAAQDTAAVPVPDGPPTRRAPRKRSEQAHRARVRRELAERPDSASTSEDDVPWPPISDVAD